MGNRWYIDKDALLAHKSEKDGLLAAVQAQSVGLLKVGNENRSSASNFSPLLTYAPDRRDLMPQLISHSTIVLEKHTDRPSPDTHQIPIRVVSDTKKQKEIINTQIDKIFQEEVEGENNFISKFAVSIPRISIFAGPYLKAAFALVVILTIGISVSKSDLIYAVLPKNSTPKNALASAATSFSNSVGGVFGPFLAKELLYQRAE